jgi:hypothetical protein
LLFVVLQRAKIALPLRICANASTNTTIINYPTITTIIVATTNTLFSSFDLGMNLGERGSGECGSHSVQYAVCNEQ